MKASEIIEQNGNNIINLYNEGFMQKEIADIYNVSKSSVARFLRKSGITSKVNVSKDDELKIVDLYENGNSQVQIARMFDIGDRRVSEILHRYNVHIKQPNEVSTKYTLNEKYFDNIDSQDQAYIIGLLYSDGCHYGNHISISLQARDKDILDKINERLSSNRTLRFIDMSNKNKNHQDQYQLCIVNKYMSKQLDELGVVQNKSLILSFPDWLKPYLYSHFIRGLMDGDGYISKNPKECRISLICTESICIRISSILKENLNIHAGMSLCHGNANTSTRTLRISGKKQVKKFLDYIYKDADLFLQRKYDIYKLLYCNDDTNNSLSA